MQIINNLQILFWQIPTLTITALKSFTNHDNHNNGGGGHNRPLRKSNPKHYCEEQKKVIGRKLWRRNKVGTE